MPSLPTTPPRSGPVEKACHVSKSGGEIDNCVMKLLAHCYDSNDQVYHLARFKPHP